MYTKNDDGFEVEVIEHRDDVWTFVVDGEYVGVRRERGYGSGPMRYLWSAYELDDVPEPATIVRSLGSFHHPARVLNGSVASAVLHMVRSADWGES